MGSIFVHSHNLIVERHSERERLVVHGLQYRINTNRVPLTNLTDGYSDVTKYGFA